MILRICCLVIRVAGLLTPRELRTDWTEQWSTEIWYARDESPVRLLRFSAGAFADAADLRRSNPVAGNSSICLVTLAAAALVAFLGTGGFESCREAMRGPEKVMLLARSLQVLGMDAAPSSADLMVWQRRSHGIELAGFWVHGQVLKTTPGFDRVIALTSQTPFHLFGKTIEVIKPSELMPERIGVVARLDGTVGLAQAEAELAQISSRNGCTVIARSLGGRMREPLIFAAAVFAVMIIAGGAVARGSWVFFLAKTAMVEFLVVGVWAELATGLQIPSTGGTGLTLIFLYPVLIVTAALALWWSLSDQRARCPVCCRVLSLPVRIGSHGSILLDRAVVEVLCTKGHGSLLLRGPERALWTPFHESWKGC